MMIIIKADPVRHPMGMKLCEIQKDIRIYHLAVFKHKNPYR